MRLLLILWIATIATTALAEPNAATAAFEAGKEVRLDIGKTVGEILVYVPIDYNDDCNWPIMFYYHGQGGHLSTQWLQIATGGKGFIIVSMEFVSATPEKVTPPQYQAYLQKEIKNFGFARHWLAGRLRTDNKMTVLAGVSRGGWQVADIFSGHPRLAAAAVITAAGYNDWAVTDGSSLAGKYVYIGAGETDQNFKAAKKAAGYFTNRNADVTFEVYAGLGHEINPHAEKLQKWFSDLRDNLIHPPAKMQPTSEIKQ